MAPMDAIEGESETPREALPTVSPLDKIIVAFAGPLFSMGLALAFALIVWACRPPAQPGGDEHDARLRRTPKVRRRRPCFGRRS